MRPGIDAMKGDRSYRSQIEILEARIAPATIFVTSLADSGDGSLRAAIEKANVQDGADVIKFKVKGEILLESALPSITDPLSILGKGSAKTIIDGAGAHRILEIASATPVNVTISGVTLENGRALGDGGALAIDNPGGKVVIAKSVIQDNSAVGQNALAPGMYGGNAQGGGIANHNAQLVLNKVTISGNSAIGGNGANGAHGAGWPVGLPGAAGGVGGAGKGGGLFNGDLATLTVIKSTISGNTAHAGAGGNGGNGGSGTYIGGGGGTGGPGGAAMGGGLSNDGVLVLQRSTISGNSALGGDGGRGGFGGIANMGPSGMNGAGADGGDAYGGGLSSERMLVVERSTVSANESTGGEGGSGFFGAIADRGSGYGGGISVSGSAEFSKSTIIGNEARLGGGVASGSGELVLKDSRVSENHAVVGGGIHGGNGALRLINTTVADNVAEALAGGIFSEGNLALAKSRVTGNTAGFGPASYYMIGGGVVVAGDGTISDSVISDNKTTGLGGGIMSGSGELVIERSIISSNRADMGGGGIASYSGTMVVRDSKILDNTAQAGGGGGIQNSGSGSLWIERSTISFNSTEENGGGVHNSQTGQVTIRESTISANTASLQGGGVFNSGTASMVIERSTLSGNIADQGGGISQTGGAFSLLASTVAFNRAVGTHGGGLSVTVAIEIIASTIARNVADEQGGGIWIDPALGVAAVYAENSIVADNSGALGSDVHGALSARHSLIESEDGAVLTGGSNLTGIDPLLGPLKKNGGLTLTMAPKAKSPVVDSGFIYGDLLYDQTGAVRHRGSGIDIGAVEVR